MKAIGIDAYCHLDSPIHRWDARAKLVSLFVLMLVFASIDRLFLLPVMLAVSGLAYAMSRLPLSFWRDRLRWPGTVLLAIALILPFAGGETELWRLGPIAIYGEGLLALVQISARILTLLTLGLVLFGTTPFPTLIRTARSLGLPGILADMTLLSYRYLYELGGYLNAMQTALRLRGLRLTRLNRKQLPIVAATIGTLLVRSYEQSERVYSAMRLRGYSRASATGDRPQARSSPSFSHLAAAGGTIALAITFLLVETLAFSASSG